MSASKLAQLAEPYKALAHPVRLRILAMLRRGELCVCQLTAVLRLAPSTVSAHLAELRRAGLLVERKQGRWVLYRLAEGERARALLEVTWPIIAADPQVEADAAVIQQLSAFPPEDLCRAGLDLERVGVRVPAVAAGPGEGERS